MANKNNEIKTKITIDTSQADKSLGKFDKSIDKVKGSFKGTFEYISGAGKKAMSGISKITQSAKKSFNQLDDATGGLISKFKVLAKNPLVLTITAIVGAFKLLQQVMGRTGKAGETFSKISAKLSGILNGLLNVLEPVVEFIGEKLLAALNDPMVAIKDFGKAIKDNIVTRFKSVITFGDAFASLMKGNLSDAADKAKKALGQLTLGINDVEKSLEKVSEESKKRFKSAQEATERLFNLEERLLRNRIAQEKEKLKSLKTAEELRQQRDNEENSLEKRIDFNKQLGDVLQKQLDSELKIAKQNLQFARDKEEAYGETIENIQAVGDAEIALLEIQERINGQRSEQLANENALRKEAAELEAKKVEEAKAKAEEEAEKAKAEEETKKQKLLLDQQAQNEIDALDIERRREKGENVLALELDFLERKRLQEVQQADLTGKQVEAINAKYDAQKAKTRKITEKAEKAKEKAILENTINSAAEAFGITQEVAVAKMIMAAPEAIAGSFKEAAKNYAPPWSIAMGALGAAGTVAPIIKGLADIKKTRFSKSKGGSKGGSISAPTANGGARMATPEMINDLAANNASRMGMDSDLINGADSAASARVNGSSSGSVVFSENRYNNFKNQVNFKEQKTTIG